MGRLKQKKFLCHRSRKPSEIPGMNNCMIGYVFLTTVTILYFLVALACSLTGYSTIADIFMCTGYTGLGLSGYTSVVGESVVSGRGNPIQLLPVTNPKNPIQLRNILRLSILGCRRSRARR